jgi:SET domain-containing protein
MTKQTPVCSKGLNIAVQDSPLHGQGVFALRDFAKGEILERCPYLVIDDDDLSDATRLQDYLFTSPDNPHDYLCVMGYGMMYNHSDDPNAEWQIDDDDLRFVCFIAKKAISVGDEILQDYGRDYWDTRAE